MSYPEPTPPIRGRDAAGFPARLESFKLAPELKAFYKDARKLYRRMSPKS